MGLCRNVQDRCLFTVRSAFEELRKDLDPLGATASELLGAEAAAALKQQNIANSLSQSEREQQQRAERNVLGTLLAFPFPLAASAMAPAQETQEPEAAPEILPLPPGVMSAGDLSVP